MAKLVQTLILIPILISSIVIIANSQTTSFTYDFSGDHPKYDLTYQGAAQFPPETTHLRLTNPEPSQVGRVLHPTPIQFWQTNSQIDFETTINFTITPKEDKLPADGLAFFIASAGSTIPADYSGAKLGIFNSSGSDPSVFAVEFDPHVNNPSDPNFRHVGIDIGSRISSNATEVDGAITGQLVSAQINYAGATKKITVLVTAGNKTFDVTYDKDLSSFLPQKVQVGISASTGEESATHDVVLWDFSATMVNHKPSITY